MFRSRKTKIISTPVEEVLEVEAPVIEETPLLQNKTVANIEFLTFQISEDGVSFGTLTDYDGNVYHYAWDEKPKRIQRLTGPEINKLTWDLCDDVLKKYFVRPEPKKDEEPIGPQIEQAIGKVLSPVNNAIKTLEGKVEKALAAKAAPAPAPVQAAPAPRPQAVQSTPMDTPAISVGDDDISINAARFLQNSNVNDLGIDYMSL
jgi:hypothetical protein